MANLDRHPNFPVLLRPICEWKDSPVATLELCAYPAFVPPDVGRVCKLTRAPRTTTIKVP